MLPAQLRWIREEFWLRDNWVIQLSRFFARKPTW
jgi:hypothetical protein